MGETEDKIPVRRSSGKTEEMSADELEELNYQRKVRDQESTGHLITPKQINIFAAALCIIVMVYAIPRMFFFDNKQESNYIPIEQRQTTTSYTDIYKAELQAIGLQTLNNQEATSDTDIEPPANSKPLATNLKPTPNTGTPLEPGAGQIEKSGTVQPAIADVTSDKTSGDTIQQKEIIEIAQAEGSQSSVIASVKQWASDWSAQDVEAYLSHYSNKFVSEKGLDIGAWRAYRSTRVEKPDWVNVKLLDTNVDMLSDSLIQVTFTQDYSASNYKELSVKRLSLELTDNGWKIISETNLN